MSSITIAAMGDTLCRAEGGGDPFEHVRDIWRRADLRLLNLETVLTDRGKPAPKRTRLRTDPGEAHWLNDLDVLHLANNHIFDYGALGCRDTLRTFEHGRHPIGLSYKVVDLDEVGFLGFHAYPLSVEDLEVAHLEDFERVLRAVREALTQVSELIISLHWGAEHAPHPSPLQIAQAHALIDAGAALVVGHGPHRVQAIERYKDGLIAYSLGNFNFVHTDIREREYNRWSVILTAEVDGRRVVDFGVNPIKINQLGQPVPMKSIIWPTWLLYAVFSNLAENAPSWRQWYEEMGPTYIRQSLRSFAATIPRYGWPRIRKFWWWLKQPQTRQAFLGALRAVRS